MKEFLNLSSVEKRRNYCREFFSNLGTGLFRPYEDNAGLFTLLLDNHPEKEKKIGCGIKYFRLCKNKLQKNSFHIDIIRKDDTITSFSWRDCCRLEKMKINPKDRLKGAFRTAISGDVLEFLNSNQNKICSNCGSLDKIQIDHIYPFSKILNGFICSKDGYEFPNEFNKTPINTYCFKDEDKELEKEFIKYHRKYARYQYLCRSCNVKKSDNI